MSRAQDVRRLLEEEQAILLAGRLSDLQGLSERKERLLRELSETDGDALKALAFLAERNARLLEAAGRGVKAALHQMRDARGGGALRTYDQSGAAHEHGGWKQGLERRF
ncbi:hypothetical protein GQ651_10060 [Alphaproteobacteria bacterium GH1-50]|uniref:FlgN protein n=1 Tax=Kangsaoukella pontilimi TaxID=2691042 RepID=A0A7C9IS18_9RHOB|nr:hypothetical protein [Kangsaoukella pontilimi]MXQ08186.1 hypothetical protein [Kangsaoukella pontilimi]